LLVAAEPPQKIIPELYLITVIKSHLGLFRAAAEPPPTGMAPDAKAFQLSSFRIHSSMQGRSRA
jgi:hypothetical protein